MDNPATTMDPDHLGAHGDPGSRVAGAAPKT
jgi:hypothetical protein